MGNRYLALVSESEYDEEGRKIYNKISFSELYGGQTCSETYYTYESGSVTVTTKDYNSGTVSTVRTDQIKDDNGNVISETVYNVGPGADGTEVATEVSKTEYTYDEQGNSTGYSVSTPNAEGGFDVTYYTAELILLIGGIALMITGSARLRQEQVNHYVQLINDAQQEKNRGNYEEALDLAQQAQILIDSRMEAYTEEAAVYFDQGVKAISKEERNDCFRRCVATVQEILQADVSGGTTAEWAKAYFVGAESCVELENYVLAQKWYRSAIELAPTESGYRGLICAYAFDENLEEAKAVLEEMQAALPGTDAKASAELIQAELCYLEKDYFGAVQHYKTLFQTTNDETLLRRAYLAANNACVYGGNALLSQGIALLEEACQRLPSAWGIYKPLLANSYYTQAYLVEEEQREVWLEKALQAFGCVKAEYLGIEDRLTMNKIRIEQNLLWEAQEDLLIMEQLYPKDYRVYMRLSHLYLAQYAQTYIIEYRTKAEEAYQTAKECYEESGVVDSEMIAFINSWQQYVQDES